MYGYIAHAGACTVGVQVCIVGATGFKRHRSSVPWPRAIPAQVTRTPFWRSDIQGFPSPPLSLGHQCLTWASHGLLWQGAPLHVMWECQSLYFEFPPLNSPQCPLVPVLGRAVRAAPVYPLLVIPAMVSRSSDGLPKTPGHLPLLSELSPAPRCLFETHGAPALHAMSRGEGYQTPQNSCFSIFCALLIPVPLSPWHLVCRVALHARCSRSQQWPAFQIHQLYAGEVLVFSAFIFISIKVRWLSRHSFF